MLRFQPGVQVQYYNPRLTPIFEYASAWSALAHIAVDVNSIDDRQHGPNSLHGWSLAADLDTDGDRPADLVRLYGFLARYLPGEYDVILEGDHVHVEWDARRRSPPAPPPTSAPPGAAA